MSNPICHFEIGCRDQAKAKQFYSSVFAWRFEIGKSGQEMIRTGADVGGHLNPLEHLPHNYTIFYVMVGDIRATIAKAESAGGKKLVGPIPMDGGKSEYAWIADLEGNIIGVYSESK
ncbi:MAG TPA: VOC family protein [Terriglobales bacterium]|nr:VOC family protein [Terriglobales bacterium]